MTINFLGDSITAGAGAGTVDNMYTTMIGKQFGVKVNNYGVSGTRIARQRKSSDNPKEDEDFLLRATKMGPLADFVFVFGGTNDYGHGDAPIGKYGDRTPFSFYGALTLLVEYLIGVYGREKACFILPLPRAGDENRYGDGSKKIPTLTLNGYRKVMEEVLERYGIDFLDLCEKFPKTKLSELTIDGLHPNPEGNRILAGSVCTYLQRKGFIKNDGLL